MFTVVLCIVVVGLKGTGRCTCPFFYIGSPTCSNPIYFCMIVCSVFVCVVLLVRYYYRSKRVTRSLVRHAMDLEVTHALLEEDHVAEINSFEEGWKIEVRRCLW